jgi:hydroxypyruvate isomerase
MPRFAANLSMMFNEVPFAERFEAAAKAGFDAVEYLFPYELPAATVGELLRRHRLTQALFNLPPGDWAAGERGMAALPGRQEEFRQSVVTALAYAGATGCRTLHMMAGNASAGDPKTYSTYLERLGWAADLAREKGVTIVIEPINHRDMPEYFLNDFNMAIEIIAACGRPNVRLQYDIYHRQILHGDVSKSLESMLPIIAHIQVASVPLRHEPGTGELNDFHLFALLDRIGYDGFVGCEYRPAGETLRGLSWLDAWNSGRSGTAV